MTDELRYSAKRARTYTRKFDHDEVRRRYVAGEKGVDLAAEFGVSVSAVYKVIQRPNTTSSTPTFIPAIYRCPTCQGPKGKRSELCRQCRSDTRLAPPKLVRHPASRIEVLLASVDAGHIVEFEGDYAVVEFSKTEQNFRWLHFWTGPPLKAANDTMVKVLAYTEVVA